MNNEKKINLDNEEEKKCCGDHEGHDHEGCNCNGDHGDEGCNCSGDHGDEGCNCSGGHDHDGCNGHEGEHEHNDTVTLELEDGSELVCPIIDIFEVSEQEYIALLHPTDETVLLYRFFDYEDGTIEITVLEDDAEYKIVSETFMALQDELEEENQE